MVNIEKNKNSKKQSPKEQIYHKEEKKFYGKKIPASLFIDSDRKCNLQESYVQRPDGRHGHHSRLQRRTANTRLL